MPADAVNVMPNLFAVPVLNVTPFPLYPGMTYTAPLWYDMTTAEKHLSTLLDIPIISPLKLDGMEIVCDAPDFVNTFDGIVDVSSRHPGAPLPSVFQTFP